MQRIEITHTTLYRYAEPVRFLEHKLHLRPREGHDIRIESSALHISPAYNIRWQRDVYGNSVALVDFSEAADRLEIVSTVVVEHYESDINALDRAQIPATFPFDYEPMEQIDLVPYETLVFPEQSEIFDNWLNNLRPGSGNAEPLQFIGRVNQRLTESLGYIVRDEPGVQSPTTTLTRGQGSCRDMATLFIETCRRFGLASRFVSGYLVSAAAVDDIATTHAWAEVYLPGAGWRGFDSTSGQLVGGEHIAVAVHRHPEAIPPVSGAFIGPIKPRPKMQVEVRVNRL
jgi:transglutaminase-like putative cysteine protease